MRSRKLSNSNEPVWKKTSTKRYLQQPTSHSSHGNPTHHHSNSSWLIHGSRSTASYRSNLCSSRRQYLPLMNNPEHTVESCPSVSSISRGSSLIHHDSKILQSWGEIAPTCSCNRRSYHNNKPKNYENRVDLLREHRSAVSEYKIPFFVNFDPGRDFKRHKICTKHALFYAQAQRTFDVMLHASTNVFYTQIAM